jgi:DNA-binding transcriptional LysR family regulator
VSYAGGMMELPAGFDLKALRIFVVVAKAASMTEAAEKIGTTQSAISQNIHALEKSLGIELFDRSLRPIAMTPAGHELYAESLRVLSSAGDAYWQIVNRTKIKYPSMTIAMAESLANTIGPLILRGCGHLAESLRIWSGTAEVNHLAFLDRNLDMIMTTSPALDWDVELEHHPLLTEPFVCVLPMKQPDPNGDLRKLTSAKFIRCSYRSAIGKQIGAQLARMKLNFPPYVEFDTIASQIGAVADGMGWTISTPLCLAQVPHLLAGLKLAPFADGKLTRTASLIARNGEFGGAPSLIASVSRQLLRDRVLTKILCEYPWLSGLVEWHGDPKSDRLAAERSVYRAAS